MITWIILSEKFDNSSGNTSQENLEFERKCQ